MTAAKIMEIISRLPRCDGQAADAVSAYIPRKMEDAHQLLKIPKSECPDIWIRPPRHKNGLNHGPVWKIQSFLLNAICVVILWQDYYGNGNLRKSYWSMAGKRFPIVNAFSYTVKKDSSYLCMWMTYHTSFLDHVYLGCTRRQCEISKDVVDNYRTMFESRISAGATENYHARKIWVSLRGLLIWKVMPRSVWNDIVSWQTRRLNNSTKYELHALMTIISTSKNWNPWERSVKSMLSNCSKMLVLGTYWTTWYSMVTEQTCTIDHKMDQSLWQTLESIDFIYSSYMWM